MWNTPAQARAALGLGTIATSNLISPSYFWIGNALSNVISTNLNGDATMTTNGTLTLANTSQARSNLGLGSAAILNLTLPVSVANGGSAQTTARNAGTNIGIMQMSASGGGNYLTDMQNATPTFEGQLGLSYSGNKSGFLWQAGGTGLGTNGWGYPLYFPGGIGDVGSQLYDIPHALGNGSMNFYFGGGPTFSRKTNVWNGVSQVDSGIYIHNVNPFSSGGTLWIPMYGTNIIDNGSAGTFLFTNLDGVDVYLESQFGIQLDSIPTSDPIGETNQAGSYCIIGNQTYPFFISWNMTVTNTLGQYPFFAIDTRHRTNAGLPYLVGVPSLFDNVFMPTNPLWQWALAVDPLGKNVFSATNGVTVVSNFQSYAGPSGPYFRWGRISGEDASVAFEVNTNANFNFPSAVGAVTWDSASGNHRSGLVSLNTQYPGIGYAKGGSFSFYQTSGADLQSSLSSQTWTNELKLDANGNATFNGTITAPSISTFVGSLSTAINTTSTSLSLSVTNSTMLVTATGQIITLPDATSNCTGRQYTIKLTATGTCTVTNATGGQNIDGALSYTIPAKYGSVTVQSDGSNWFITGKY
jgi:hypothetical protein